MATAFPEKQWLLNKWQKKNNTLAGFLILWVAKMAFPKANQLHYKAIFSTYKINAKTSDLTTKVLKTIFSYQRNEIFNLMIYILREE